MDSISPKKLSALSAKEPWIHNCITIQTTHFTGDSKMNDWSRELWKLIATPNLRSILVRTILCPTHPATCILPWRPSSKIAWVPCQLGSQLNVKKSTSAMSEQNVEKSNLCARCNVSPLLGVCVCLEKFSQLFPITLLLCAKQNKIAPT